MSSKRPEIQKLGGDITFISVSPTAEKLRKFLELNPEVPADRGFVDTSKTFEAYKAAGFGNLTDVDKSTKPEMKPPGFSLQDWWKYITNVNSEISNKSYVFHKNQICRRGLTITI